MVAMMSGEVEFDNSFSETVVTLEGSVQLIFIGFFVTANIVIINVLISIAITALRDAEVIREDLTAMARALAVLELEQGLKWLQVGSYFYSIQSIMLLIKMTGETLEVRSDKRKPRMLLRHRTTLNIIQHHTTSYKIIQHYRES